MISQLLHLCKWQFYKKAPTWGQGVQFQFGFWVGKAIDYLSQVSLPLMELDYETYREVFLICVSQQYASKVCLDARVSILELLVCQLGSLSPCICQTWYWRSKDHSHSEQNCTSGIYHDLSVPAKISQHSCDTFLASLGRPKSCKIPEVCFGSLRLWQFMTAD